MHQGKKQNGVVEDRLSALPSPILCNILSSLSTREAGKTSVLSSTWRHVWKTPKNLVLDANNFLDAVTNTSHDLSETSRFKLKCDRTWAFLHKVNLYLLRLSEFDPYFTSKIENLTVDFTFRRDGPGCYNLAQWIGFALDRKVDEINLCFSESHELSAPSHGPLLLFPCEVLLNKEFAFVNSCLKRVCLAHCALASHPAFNPGFATITTLDLVEVDLVGGEHVQGVLGSCHSLECLSLSKCYNMECLKIEYPSCQKLRQLNVSLCYNLKGIVLRSSSLESMEYTGTGCLMETMFDTPKLKSYTCRMVVGNHLHREMLEYSRLSIDLPQLETLFLECNCHMTHVPVNPMANSIVPTFPNLRHLIVTKEAVYQQNFRWIEIVLKGCPILTRLDINIWTHMKFDVECKVTNWLHACPHSNLKEVTITGIGDHQSDIEIAVYLLQNASELQKMTIDPRRKVYLGNGKWSHSQVCEGWTNGGKQRLCDLLYQQFQHLPSSDKISFRCDPYTPYLTIEIHNRWRSPSRSRVCVALNLVMIVGSELVKLSDVQNQIKKISSQSL